MKIRNAFQKIKTGDVVYWRSFDSVKRGTVVAKEKGGALQLDGERFIYSCDVEAIERNGEIIH